MNPFHFGTNAVSDVNFFRALLLALPFVVWH